MKRARGLYDEPMWAGFAERKLLLQQCTECRSHRYPPAGACPECLSPQHRWVEAAGSAQIVSWAIFHKQYLSAYKPPYNVIAVKLAEGPLMVSNLEGPRPQGSWIGCAVSLAWADTESGPLPRFNLA